MKRISLIILSILLSHQLLSANDGNLLEANITLCSGTTITWDEYLEMRQCKEEEYDLEIESADAPFTPFSISMINNTEGAWSSVIQMPLVAAAAAQMPDGRIMTWSARDKLAFGGNQGRTWTALFDPATNSAQDLLIENTSHDMFCPGINTLPDGRILVAGGSSSNKSSIYDPYTNGWSTNGEMNVPRGYLSNVTLASGATFLIGGSWSGGIGGKDSEIWSEKSGWFKLPGVPVEAVIEGINSTQPERQDDYFPWLWVAPNGKIFHAGPSRRMHWIDPTGVGSYTYAGNRGNDTYAISGTTVMYDVGKILKTGGSAAFEDGSAASSRCYTIDFNQDNPIVNQVQNMNFPRVYHNSVVLPNGEVIAIGGIPNASVFSDNNSVLVPEIWNPNTQNWTSLAPMAVPRNYHSVALLMRDGRIFTAGGGLCNTCSTNHPDAEIYSPPYLFNANGTLASRPNLNNVPATADYNTNITVSTNSAVSSFALVRNSAVTHSTNNEQRRIPISYTNLGNNQYRLAIPNRNILPPGTYMLFTMNTSGTPSIAQYISIGDDINDCTPVSNPNLGGNGLSATYFNNIDLTNPVLDRIDATVNFNWGMNAPATSVGVETFSVRWEGAIQVPRSGTYTFYTNSDDGVRLWVDDKAIVDNWTDHGNTEDKGMIHLEPGQRYDIKMEYYDNTGNALAQLRWSGPGVLKEIIPSGNLFPIDPCLNTAPIVTSISKTDASCGQNNGTITFNFPDNPSRSNIEFSINGGVSWPSNYNSADNVGNFTINNLSTGSYDLFVRWGNDDCPIDLPNRNINTTGGGTPGTACNDGNPNTINDVIQSDGCTCAGTSVGGGCSAVASGGNGVINVTGLTDARVYIKIYRADNSLVTACNNDCGNPFSYDVPNGNYSVVISTFTSNWQQVCDLTQTVTVGGGQAGPCDNQGGDSDGDGVCNNQDCAPNNANLPTTPGSTCNDGNANTNNDVIQSDGCTCAGTPTGGNPCDNQGGDSDGDGVCNNQDCAPNNANLPTTPGSTCNDGNSNTNNDVIQSDGCTCAGTPVGGGCGAVASGNNGAITITGLTDARVYVKVYRASDNELVTTCNNDCGNPFSYNVPNGTYSVVISTFTTNWQQVCDITQTVTVGGGGQGGPCDNQGGDSDGDGVCNNQDCAPNNANLPTTPGNSCNDGNSNTNNDIIQSDGCTCAGTPVGGGGCAAVATSSNGVISVSGLTDARVYVKVYRASDNGLVTVCNNDCGNPFSYNVPNGDYLVLISTFTSNWQQVCNLSETVTVTGSPLGRFGITSREDFALYPNPANDQVSVVLDNYQEKDITIQLVDQTGKVMKEKLVTQLNETNVQIDLEGIKNGMYFVFVRTKEGHRFSKKLMVMKPY